MSPRRGTSRRTTRWATFDSPANALVSGTSEVQTVVSAANDLIGATILRVVGNIAFHGTTVDTANRYVCGLIVAPNTIDAADLDPITDANLDWLYWSSRGTNNAAYDGVDSFVLDRHMIDVRGRRKIDEGEALFYSEHMSGTGGNSYKGLRVLILNP